MRALAFIAECFLVVLLVTGCGSGSQPAPAPPASVLVTIEKPQRGSMPNWLVAYGSATPAINATQTLNVQQPGQVTRLAATPRAAVRAGQPLVIFTTAPSALSSYRQATIMLRAAQSTRATTAQLLRQQLATRDELAKAQSAVAGAQIALDALRREGADQATRTLSAPFDGIISAVSVAQGDRLQAGAPLVTVARTGGIVATVGIDPNEQNRVRVGQPARLELLSGTGKVAGRVVRVDSALNPTTRLVDVDIVYPAGAFMPGEALRASIETGTVAGWIVPHRAVITGTGAPHIFQVAGDKAVAVKVSVLQTNATTDVVEGPLDARRPLIVDGSYQVQSGSLVRWSKR